MALAGFLRKARALVVPASGAPAQVAAHVAQSAGHPRPRGLEYANAPAAYLSSLTFFRLGSIYGVAGALIFGDALGNLGHWPSRSWTLWCAIGAVAFLFLCRRGKTGLLAALLALAGSAALAAGELGAQDRGALSIRRYPDGTHLTVEGTLWREPERSYGRQRLLIRVERASAQPGVWEPRAGMVRATLLHGGDYRVGDRLLLSARLRFPRNYGDPGEFDYEAFMARAGIAATMLIAKPEQITLLSRRPWPPWTQIERARAHIARFIDSNLAYPEREEARALVIGDRGGLGDRLRDDFALTAMAHLLVISGLHMGFVAAAAFMLARLALSMARRLLIFGLANKIAALAAAFAVIAYALIAGHHVSTIRAVIMVVAYAAATIADRSREPLAALATAAAAIILTLPGSTADIGFQLSFASVAAIVLGMRRYGAWWLRLRDRRMLKLRPAWPVYRAAGWMGGYLALSGYVALGVSALTAYHFNQFSLVGPLANAVVVPVMGLIGTLGALSAAALSFWLPSVAGVVLRAASSFLGAGTYLAAWFAGWPLGWARCFTPTAAELAIFYGLLLLWLTRPIAPTVPDAGPRAGYLRRSHDADEKRRVYPSGLARWRQAAAVLLLLALAADGAWWSYQRFFNPTLRITFLAVGQGDAAVIRFPGSQIMVIDGGGGLSPAFDPGERLVARYLWSQKILRVGYLTLSHPDFDHYGGLIFLARNFRPREFWAPDVASPDPHYAALLSALAQSGARLRLLDSSAVIHDIGGATLRCLNPPVRLAAGHNDNSLVLALARGAYQILFTGDIEARAEQALAAAYPQQIRSAVLKVPHHGSDSSSTPVFVEAVQPAVALISVGHLNRFQFPAPAVVERYAVSGARVLRTDEDGAITVEINGGTMRVRTNRAAAGARSEFVIRRAPSPSENG